MDHYHLPFLGPSYHPTLGQYWLQYLNLVTSNSSGRKILYEQSRPELSSYRSPVASEIFCSRKTGVRVGYTLCTIPSVKIYATREWSCDYVSLYPASTRGIRRELPFGDICIDECKLRRTCFEQEHYCKISQRIFKERTETWLLQKCADVSPGNHSHYQGSPVTSRVMENLTDPRFNFSRSYNTSGRKLTRKEQFC